MKIWINLIIVFVLFHTYAQESYFINAQNGLNVRSDSDLSSTKVAKIPFGVIVKKMLDTGKEITIIDNGKPITGNWIKIKYDNYLYLVSKETEPIEKEGYVFDGYLKKVKNENIINNSWNIDRQRFNQLKEQALKQIKKPKKIANLDSIKMILKNRVAWVTEFENEGYKREDAIKSIKTENGQKLIFNQHSNDYGFSEGWSGYYPEYDILFLEGGHSSDRCFSIQTGETELTIGNPEYIIPAPKNTYRLNGYWGGHECISYFFQQKINGKFMYLTQFNWNYDICTLKEFYWITETSFIYKTNNYDSDAPNGVDLFFKGEIKTIDTN